tara:strand:+ start:396 stop:1175 length:780 start_codon:yes stop_codon:yes gene_type:complete
MATYESKKYAIIPVNATQIANGSVDNTEFQYLNGVTSAIQTQLDSKLASAGAFTVQTGMILPFSAAAASIPTGYLNCDGSAVSRSTYSVLFALISTTYGAGNGSSTFNVPNIAGRMIIGKSGTYSLASTGGATTDSFTPAGTVSGNTAAHALTESELPAHNHSFSGSSSGTITIKKLASLSGGGPGSAALERVGGSNAGPESSSSDGTYASFSGSVSGTVGDTGSGSGHTHGLSASFSGSAGTVDILNPYISVNYIIKT